MGGSTQLWLGPSGAQETPQQRLNLRLSFHHGPDNGLDELPVIPRPGLLQCSLYDRRDLRLLTGQQRGIQLFTPPFDGNIIFSSSSSSLLAQVPFATKNKRPQQPLFCISSCQSNHAANHMRSSKTTPACLFVRTREPTLFPCQKENMPPKARPKSLTVAPIHSGTGEDTSSHCL